LLAVRRMARRKTASGVITALIAQNYLIQLTNATIVDIEFTLPHIADPALTRLSPCDEVSFIYQKIEWQWLAGGITATDTVHRRACGHTG
jgi:type VI secretion system Hcp family effector